MHIREVVRVRVHVHSIRCGFKERAFVEWDSREAAAAADPINGHVSFAYTVGTYMQM